MILNPGNKTAQAFFLGIENIYSSALGELRDSISGQKNKTWLRQQSMTRVLYADILYLAYKEQ